MTTGETNRALNYMPCTMRKDIFLSPDSVTHLQEIVSQASDLETLSRSPSEELSAAAAAAAPGKNRCIVTVVSSVLPY